MQDTRRRITFDTDLIKEDLADRGWLPIELVRRTGLADMTIYRFLSGHTQTAKTAKAIADAFGKSVRRYRRRASKVA
jgi:hypothetical protein